MIHIYVICEKGRFRVLFRRKFIPNLHVKYSFLEDIFFIKSPLNYMKKNIDEITSMDNTLIYIPVSGIEKDGMTALYGTITFSKVTDNVIEGTFEGGGVKTSVIDEMGNVSLSEVENLITEFSGEFKAVGVTKEK